MHALIIEDEPITAMLIEDELRALGYASVDFAVTEAEAVAAARRRCPDLITADVGLPEGCGIAAVETICGGQPIPVVFITANAAEVRTRLRGTVVVPKPFGASHISKAIWAATALTVRPGPVSAAQ